MTDRPIIFSGPMVRAILEGRKTQTRRVVRAPTEDLNHPAVHHWQMDQEHRAVAVAHSEKVADQYITTFPHYRILCPYGVPGDRLWVRETGWQRPERSPRDIREGADTWPPYEYDAAQVCTLSPDDMKNWGWKRRPAIHMPRWASRIKLEVTGVRIERLQEISHEDAEAEGFARLSKDGQTWKYGIPDRDGEPGNDDDGWHWQLWDIDARIAYKRLWDSINAKRAPWSSNPWVWVIEFRRAA